MAEIALSFVLDQLLPVLRKEANMLRGVHKDFADIKDELESIQAFIKDADRRAAAEGDNISEGVKTWVKQVREASFRIEDIIDEYLFYVGRQPCHPAGCVAPLFKVTHLIKTMIPRHRIVSEIQDIKSCVREIKERSDRYGFQNQSFFEQGSSNSQNAYMHEPRMASLYLEEDEIVGIEGPRDELIHCLVDKVTPRTVISVVGTGGSGKTTLAKKVFDNLKVTGHFDCHAWITVSQSYIVEGLLRSMLLQFCKERREDPLGDIPKMDQQSLINEVRKYLQQKRYMVFFDDVWKVNFWDEIEFALFDNKLGSRILITTRNVEVAGFCKKSSFVHVHDLQPLPLEKSWELFCKRAFRFEFNGCCPKELTDVSFKIVQKCKGLPLAVAAIGGLLCTKEKNAFEWQKICQNLSSELEMNPHLTSITKILALSYDDLPHYLKSCFLYFGIYPEDYSVEYKTLIRQWIGEGFVKYKKGKTLEEVAKQYLKELIDRNLVQVSDFDYESKVESCRVHDLTREMILQKMKDLSFCHFVSIEDEDDQSIFDGIIRRLAITTTSIDLVESLESSRIRSLLIFGNYESNLPEFFMRRIPKKYRLLKVLNFEALQLDYVPDNLGDLFHLRYLSLRYTRVRSLPKSIGKLQNLEILDLRGSWVSVLPREINMLKKLCHLATHLGYFYLPNSVIPPKGSKITYGIGNLTSLETLCYANVSEGRVELITELEKLRQLRHLGLTGMRQEHNIALCASINGMHKLETLHIATASEDQVIDLQFLSSPQQLCWLRLEGKLENFPNWIQRLQNLVQLTLVHSRLIDDPLISLKNLPNLLHLTISRDAYEGECLHFEQGWFEKLVELRLALFPNVNSILIDRGALPSLKNLELNCIHQLKDVPFGIQHLAKLETLDIRGMPDEFVQSIDPDKGGQQHWIIQHVPLVYIFSNDKKRIIGHGTKNHNVFQTVANYKVSGSSSLAGLLETQNLHHVALSKQ